MCQARRAGALRRRRTSRYVPNPRVPELMQSADVLLMPSLEEGFPRRLLEAMATGLPFVVTDVGGVAEVVPELARRMLVTPGDAAGMARRAAELLEQPELRHELSAVRIAHVERYAVERVAPLFLREVGPGVNDGARGRSRL